MMTFFKRSIYALSNRIGQKITGSSPEGKQTYNFARLKKSPFNIKAESSYNAYLSKGALELALKKTNSIAWVNIPKKEYSDKLIEARIRLDSLGGYAAAGIVFRVMDEDSYCMALVSSKGYFRLDIVKNNTPRPLIAWTEIPDFKTNADEISFNLNILVYGTYIIIFVNGIWLGEAINNSIMSGSVGFALASYIEAGEQVTDSKEYFCKACLDYISIDTRINVIESEYKKWTDDSNINAENRLRLAETFAVMGESSKALEQITKAWKRRDEVIYTVSATSTVRTKRELLLAARMSFRIRQYREAEKHINSIIDQWPDSEEGKLAFAEKLKILNELDKFAELKEFVLKYPSRINKDIDYYTFLGRCYWELKDYEDSAIAWENAFELNRENGVYAVNAANAQELAGNEEKAVALFIDAGKLFLNQGNMPEMEALMRKLSVLGSKNWEARTLAGKWAYSIEDYNRCTEEFAAANKLRNAIKPRPKEDPASCYLWGLVLYLQGKNKEALRLLEKAVKFAPDYGLFRFKLTEIKIKSGVKDTKRQFVPELKLALEHMDMELAETMANHAGNLLRSTGDKENAKYFFEKAQPIR